MCTRNVTAVYTAPISSFSVYASGSISNFGGTTVTGYVGVSPGSPITGFPPGISILGLASTEQRIAAQIGALAAYNDASSRVGAIVIDAALGGVVLPAGIYTSSSGAFSLTGRLTLDGGGNPSAAFIF